MPAAKPASAPAHTARRLSAAWRATPCSLQLRQQAREHGTTRAAVAPTDGSEGAVLQVKIQEGQGLPADHPDSQLVREVGLQIVSALQHAAKSADGYTRHLDRYNWEFTVLDSKQANAFVVPGGKVVVYTGTLHPWLLRVWNISADDHGADSLRTRKASSARPSE